MGLVESNRSSVVARFSVLKCLNEDLLELLPFAGHSPPLALMSAHRQQIPTRGFEFRLDSVVGLDFGTISSLLASARALMFSYEKHKVLTRSVRNSGTTPKHAEDDYDYPEDLPQVLLNRPKAAAAICRLDPMARLSASLFGQLFLELHFLNPMILRIAYTHPMDDGQQRSFKVKFEGEGVDDYGGPYRECFTQISSELQAVKIGADKRLSCVLPLLQLASKSKRNNKADTGALSYVFNPEVCHTRDETITNASSSSACPFFAFDNVYWDQVALRIEMFAFLGQLIGIAIRNKIYLPLYFEPIVWKLLVGDKIELVDLKQVNMDAFIALSDLRKLAQANKRKKSEETLEDAAARAGVAVEVLEILPDLRWTITLSDGSVRELRKGGHAIPVQFSDIDTYVNLAAQTLLGESRVAATAVRLGLCSVIPASSIGLFTWRELKTLVCGSEELDLDLLEQMTEYDDDITSSSPHIRMFWSVLRKFSPPDKAAFLRFVWARSRLPSTAEEFNQKFKVQEFTSEASKRCPDDHLPNAHTCFFSLNLPRYTSHAVMRRKLLYAIHNCVEMDADFRLTDSEMTGWENADSEFAATSRERPGL